MCVCVFVCLGSLSQGCSGDERLMGRAMSDVLSKEDKQVVMEDQEPAEFWVALGGKAPYARDKRYSQPAARHSHRSLAVEAFVEAI